MYFQKIFALSLMAGLVQLSTCTPANVPRGSPQDVLYKLPVVTRIMEGLPSCYNTKHFLDKRGRCWCPLRELVANISNSQLCDPGRGKVYYPEFVGIGEGLVHYKHMPSCELQVLCYSACTCNHRKLSCRVEGIDVTDLCSIAEPNQMGARCTLYDERCCKVGAVGGCHNVP